MNLCQAMSSSSKSMSMSMSSKCFHVLPYFAAQRVQLVPTVADFFSILINLAICCTVVVPLCSLLNLSS